MTNWDPKVLTARIAVLEEAVRTLQSSNTELRDRIDLFLDPAGQFPANVQTTYGFCTIIKIRHKFKQVD
jgi:hypothetical protein